MANELVISGVLICLVLWYYIGARLTNNFAFAIVLPTVILCSYNLTAYMFKLPAILSPVLTVLFGVSVVVLYLILYGTHWERKEK